MKKVIILAFLAILTLFAVGCGQQADEVENGGEPVVEVQSVEENSTISVELTDAADDAVVE